ncbi:MAG: hypothetical protein DHS20C10_01710 [marine bacterium B5-7]|nr:MAG: hypothetical protein DHS20C10_01710 [marine bacterium B5-7]
MHEEPTSDVHEKLQLPINYFGRRDGAGGMMETIMQLAAAMSPTKKDLVHFDNCYDLCSGSASISVAAMEQNIAKNYLINDLCTPLQAFYQRVKVFPSEVIENYSELIDAFHTSSSRPLFYKRLKDIYHGLQATAEQRAALFPVIMNLSDGLPRKNREKRALSPTFLDRIEISITANEFSTNVHHLNKLLDRPNVIIASDDFFAYDVANMTPNDLVIIDAPYCDQFSRGLYDRSDDTLSFHQKLKSFTIRLKAKGVPFILLYGADLLEGNAMTDDGEESLVPETHQFRHMTHCTATSSCGGYREHIYLPDFFPMDKLPENLLHKKNKVNPPMKERRSHTEKKSKKEPVKATRRRSLTI